ncbi:hypothetical protein ABZ234_18605 [Nocardiopsis sp. NPDC006198]|uniref:DUF6932 family protein n=1 Tax=Nocardiopsis sp. NPDC006198 TaxID=3154472 RepID=UPI0033BCC89B
MLVEDPQFLASETRMELWENLEEYLFTFVELGDRYSELLDGSPLVRHLWMGGSYVSSKLNPNDIDIVVFVDGKAEELLRASAFNNGQRGRKVKNDAKWLTRAFNRRRMQKEFKLDPHMLSYRPVPNSFSLQDDQIDERKYFEQRGMFDDWLQRCSPDGEKVAATEESAKQRRGYLEVQL